MILASAFTVSYLTYNAEVATFQGQIKYCFVNPWKYDKFELFFVKIVLINPHFY